MAGVLLGPRTFSMSRDSEGHRTYKLKQRVRVEAGDGPAIALQTAGLPEIGSTWDIGNDLDLWAFCLPDASTTPIVVKEGDTIRFFDIEQTFSTKPPEKNQQRCQDSQIEDPLLEPQKVSGSFTKKQEEATTDRFGYSILTSSHEVMRGPQVEFDKLNPTVKIEQNVPVLELELLASMANTVNDSPLWGLPRRCIKLSTVSWERKYYGACSVYYTRILEFDIQYETFDRDVVDEGTKVLNGEWNKDNGHWEVLEIAPGEEADYLNPSHFIRFKDRNGENTRVILNGYGVPYDPESTGTGADVIGIRHIERYSESNFLALGIPTSF